MEWKQSLTVYMEKLTRSGCKAAHSAQHLGRYLGSITRSWGRQSRQQASHGCTHDDLRMPERVLSDGTPSDRELLRYQYLALIRGCLNWSAYVLFLILKTNDYRCAYCCVHARLLKESVSTPKSAAI